MKKWIEGYFGNFGAITLKGRVMSPCMLRVFTKILDSKEEKIYN